MPKSNTLKIPVFIDAEESWIQDTIDEIATTMMRQYNKERAIVYNTFADVPLGPSILSQKCYIDAENHQYFSLA